MMHAELSVILLLNFHDTKKHFLFVYRERQFSTSLVQLIKARSELLNSLTSFNFNFCLAILTYSQWRQALL